mmetsp:Transcript_46033/g.139734  ORF Transcript_46033/g.139734 Transcript_46033/m.139734 type:complete len:102 (+) Transcript_46033:339-644(+)
MAGGSSRSTDSEFGAPVRREEQYALHRPHSLPVGHALFIQSAEFLAVPSVRSPYADFNREKGRGWDNHELGLASRGVDRPSTANVDGIDGDDASQTEGIHH